MQIPSVDQRLAELPVRKLILISQKLNERRYWDGHSRPVKDEEGEVIPPGMKLRNREDVFICRMNEQGIRSGVVNAQTGLWRIKREAADGVDVVVIAGEVTYQSFFIASRVREVLPNTPIFIEFCEADFNDLNRDLIISNAARYELTDLIANLVYLTATPKSPRRVDFSAAPVCETPAEKVYRWRSECAADDAEVLKRIPSGELIKFESQPQNLAPDTLSEITVKSLTLEELRNIMRQVPDGHVMVQTVQPKHLYTGERNAAL
jgi:hypothetical protein